MKSRGYTLIELMIVVAVIAFLAVVSVPSFTQFLAKAKRTEAYMNLSSLYVAEKAYFAEHGTYTDVLYGPQGLGWRPEGYVSGGKGEKFYYTYGFAHGAEGVNHFTGKLETSPSCLQCGSVGSDSFVLAAAGDIDGDGKADVLTVDQYNNIKVVVDDLA